MNRSQISAHRNLLAEHRSTAMNWRCHRRRFLATASIWPLNHWLSVGSKGHAATDSDWQPKYLLASCMFGELPLKFILPEVRATSAQGLDLWPRPHGAQREQVDEMGEASFRRQLESAGVRLACISQFKLGPFGLKDELEFAKRMRCSTIVTGASGPKGLHGAALKSAVGEFVERLKPHLQRAADAGVTIAIENHGNNLIQSPDALKWLSDFAENEPLGIALAPYHLPQDEQLLASLIRQLGNRISVFYAWQYGKGCMTKLPKDDELLQLPGRGLLDFRPLMSALREINYRGWTEIFMHPVPRGVPILEAEHPAETAAAVRREIVRARDYLTRCLS